MTRQSNSSLSLIYTFHSLSFIFLHFDSFSFHSYSISIQYIFTHFYLYSIVFSRSLGNTSHHWYPDNRERWRNSPTFDFLLQKSPRQTDTASDSDILCPGAALARVRGVRPNPSIFREGFSNPSILEDIQ